MSEKTAKSRRTLKQRVVNAKEAHRKRHSTTGLKFVLADSIELISAPAWDSLTQSSSYFLSREYLNVVEKAGPNNVFARYAMAFDGKIPVAAVSAQLVAIDGCKLIKQNTLDLQAESTLTGRICGLAHRAGNKAKQNAIAKVRGRMLVCGNLQSWGQHAVALSPHYAPDVHWSAIAEALYRIRRADKLSGQTDIVLVKDFSANEKGVDALESYNYRPVETDPNMVLEIPEAWRSFDDYLNGLASKYRSGAKKIVKDVTNAGIELEHLRNVDPHAKRLHELYMNVHAKAAVRLVTLSPEYLPTLAAACGDRFRCTIAKHGSEILGFITSLKDGDTSVGYYIGFDYETNQQCPVYFRLLQVCIDDAIKFGCRRVSFGRTALDPKARMGARPSPMKIWIRHRQPVLNWMIRGLLGAIPHDDAPDRNPFKAG